MLEPGDIPNSLPNQRPIPNPQIQVLETCEVLSWLQEPPAHITTPCLKEEGAPRLPPHVRVHLSKFSSRLSSQPTLTSSPSRFHALCPFVLLFPNDVSDRL